MNRLEGFRSPQLQYIDSPTSHMLQQIVSTIALLLLGYYVLSFFDAWPSTTKRTVYELLIRFTPSQFIYLLQNAMMRFGRLSEQDATFHRTYFGDFKAKEEALQRMLGSHTIPNVLHKARTLSGYDKFVQVTKEVGPPGLGNWDNSCYQNSVLQGLASLPAFQHFVHRSSLQSEKAKVSAKTTDALASFLDQLADVDRQKQTLWTPKVLKSMDSWQQQDAQEYFSRLLEAAEKESLHYARVRSRVSAPALDCLHNMDSRFSLEKDELVKRHLHTLVPNPVDGMFAQALTCQTCGFSEGVSLTQFNCLTLNLGLGGSRSLESLLDEHTQPELIEGVECDNCTRIAAKKSSPDGPDLDDENDDDKRDKKIKKELRVKEKQITFGRLPKDLVVHVNRSIWDDYGNQIKNPSFIQFPPRLGFLGKWCPRLEAEAEAVQAMYELMCIVTHSGRHDNGHYVAYGKRGKDWYCFNDEIVTKLSEDQVLSRGNVFMLFYEALDRTELLEEDGKDDIPVDESCPQEVGSPTNSSIDSEVYEEPLVEPARVSIPSMRTASGGVYSADVDGAVGRTSYVPVV